MDDATRTAIMGLEAGLADNTLAIHKVGQRLDEIDMNGHGPKLKKFLDDTAPKLETLADYLPEIIQSAQDARDTANFWRLMRKYTFWNRGGRILIQLVVAGVVAAFTLSLVSTIWPSRQIQLNPPSPTVTATPR